MQVLVVFAVVLAVASAGVVLPGPIAKPIHPRDINVASVPEGRITNGASAKKGQIPYQVALTFLGPNGAWTCGGSCISPNWVLTAGHCTDGASQAQIFLGGIVRANPKVKHTVSSSKIVQHSGYNRNTLNNDISLINMPTTPFDSDINKIELPQISSSYSTYTGETALISGFGKTSDASSSISSTLQYANVKVIDNSECAKVYGTGTVFAGCICAATPNKTSTCNGDSGGPMAVGGKQVGVTSFVSSNGCESGNPAGFVRVTHYLNWIKDNTGIKY